MRKRWILIGLVVGIAVLAVLGEVLLWRIDPASMLRRLLETDRSDAAIYQALLQGENEEAEGLILGDKSGPNLYHVPTLLEWYPEAKVIHTMRDPRAVMASELKRRQYVARSILNRKPSPALLRAALGDLEIEVSSAAMVGDRQNRDIAAGRAAGVATVWVRSEHEEGPTADATVDSLADLPALLQTWDDDGARGESSEGIGSGR